MERTLVGCSGWGYDDWVGPFYPPGTPAGEWLERYARVFRLVEVDSSFYAAPRREHVARWAAVTPPGFVFAPKVPKEVTHEGRLADPAPFREFVRRLDPLVRAGKLGPVVAQFPESFTRARGWDDLGAFLAGVPEGVRVAVELRHASWFVEETRKALRSAGAALVWNVHPSVEPPPWLTADFVYVRFIGDRALTRFDRIQRDLRHEMVAMRERLRAAGVEERQVFLLVNNHFMGHGPASVQILQEVLGLPRADLALAARDAGQRGLGEFG